MNAKTSMMVLWLSASVIAGCASTPVAAPPRIVTVTKVQYVTMPAADLLPCTVATQHILTGADVIAAWQRALQALAVCNAQVSDLKRLSDQGHP
jgi:hypothetical protein